MLCQQILGLSPGRDGLLPWRASGLALAVPFVLMAILVVEVLRFGLSLLPLGARRTRGGTKGRRGKCARSALHSQRKQPMQGSFDCGASPAPVLLLEMTRFVELSLVNVHTNRSRTPGSGGRGVAPPAGLEPTTYCLEGSCSIH